VCYNETEINYPTTENETPKIWLEVSEHSREIHCKAQRASFTTFSYVDDLILKYSKLSFIMEGGHPT
jgi:hypothetical protein